ncbi:MAG: hypothetical protein JSS99_04435 [Actinobacteria bacterium]|nr:hypothetical protein [Actinomycetota bacterium]
MIRRRGGREKAERQRLANVEFGGAFLDRELDYRNHRKQEQENTARGLIVASGVLMTVLVALAKDAGIYGSGAAPTARCFLVLALAAAVGAALCGAITQWPRRYDRLGGAALDHFNDSDFLDCPTHEVQGRTLAGRIAVAKKMDDRHEDKARWLQASFALFLVALVGLVGQGTVLALDPPHRGPSTSGRIVIEHVPHQLPAVPSPR